MSGLKGPGCRPLPPRPLPATSSGSGHNVLSIVSSLVTKDSKVGLRADCVLLDKAFILVIFEKYVAFPRIVFL